ncbi:MAG TPA: fatty acid desaturase [Vicinamibacterales bacterium]|nr:fatty acid desaturase [Vicinamibacterales bacterium]
MTAPDFVSVSYPDPHLARGRQILAAHPDVRALSGPIASSALWVVALATTQVVAAIALGRAQWWVWLPLAYGVGATIDHALWVLIHECAHNLVFRRRLPNRIVALVANVPLILPAAMGFCKYHLLHHRHMGELEWDADLPGMDESRIVGDSESRKATWLALFPVVLGIVRPRRLHRVPMVDRWTLINVATQAVAISALVAAFGWGPQKYLFASTVFAVGLHPFGARWIQEHFVFRDGQETYSYYGPLNRVSFNVGYHNEHHDIITIPWSRLPQLRALAPEFYDSLHAHHSWTRLLMTFLRDRHVTLRSRIIRPVSP